VGIHLYWNGHIQEKQFMFLRSGFLFALCALMPVLPVAVRAQPSCDALKDVKLEHAVVSSATWQEADRLKELPNVPVPRHCEVTAIARPTSDSEIRFTLWLPPGELWNGKYMQSGSGGWGGSIQPIALLGPLARGYAVSATDDGHQAAGNMPDASWAIGHPEKLIDFGYRALHETAALSKVLVDAYYGKPAVHAYFSGCSDGGREALMEAERYPEDFDGIVAGAPANNWTHHFTGFAWNEIALNATPESKITVEQLPAIEKAALTACDALDGVKDGVIQDPRQCHFDPSVLLCHGAPNAECLRQPQIDALKKIYSGPVNPRNGQQIYPGYEPGTEAEPGAWSLWIVGASVQSLFANSFFSAAVFEDPHWDWHSVDFDRDLRLADEKTASILNSNNPDLRSFRDHGGKLIEYHGWGDAAIAPLDSIAFYERVKVFLEHHPDPRSTNPSDIRSFYRLYMVPGMQHCTGGPGAVSFGNDGRNFLNATPGNDILLALDRWVTQGVAPDAIIASGVIAPGLTGADPKTGSKGVSITRPLCVYPAVARYKGSGDTNAAENFECVQPAQ
jgi:feruloyl esterase